MESITIDMVFDLIDGIISLIKDIKPTSSLAYILEGEIKLTMLRSSLE